MREMLAAVAGRIEATHPELRIELDLPSTRSAPPALLDGSAALAPMGAAMDDADRLAIRTRWGAPPVEIRVAHDSLLPAALSSPSGVLVAAGNPLHAIRLGDIRRAFAGAALRWGDLGVRGARGDHPVHLYGLAPDTAIAHFLASGPLAGVAIAPTMRPFHQSRDVAAAVAADPDGLAIANLNHAGGATRALAIIDDAGVRREPDRATIRAGRYPFDRFLLVYARRDRDRSVEPDAGIVLDLLLSPAGQAIISSGRLGYLPLSAREREAERKKLIKTQ